MASNEEIRRLAQEAEKQQLFAQKVQQQNMTLTSQLELYKEMNRILEVRDRDIIRDLEKQRDKLELDVKDYRRQKEKYQKTQKIFNQTQCNKEEKYLDDILQLQAKIKDFENIVCKMGKSTETLRLLTNEQKAFRDKPTESEQLHVFDSEETLEDAFKSQQKMTEKMNDPIVVANKQNYWTINYKKLNAIYKDCVPQKELSVEQKYFPSSSIPSVKIPVSKNMPKSKDVSNESKTADIVCNDAFGVTQELSKRIVELEKDLSKFEAKSIAFEIALQHKSRENNSLKTVQKENENFIASLQLENAHLKQTYKDLFV
ncbi:hypothetical protein Tco_0388889 [Tanacetum coccineum]